MQNTPITPHHSSYTVALRDGAWNSWCNTCRRTAFGGYRDVHRVRPEQASAAWPIRWELQTQETVIAEDCMVVVSKVALTDTTIEMCLGSPSISKGGLRTACRDTDHRLTNSRGTEYYVVVRPPHTSTRYRQGFIPATLSHRLRQPSAWSKC